MGRFLMFVSYIGTQYSGIQIQNVGGHLRTDVKTVQGVLHTCLEKLRPTNDVKIYTSSRTDAGVHALCNALHFDLQHRYYPDRDYQAETVMKCVNQILRKAREHIRVLKILRVSDNFHCRHRAVSRQYVYRLCLIKDGCHFKPGFSVQNDELASRVFFHELPISPLEFSSSYCVVRDVDIYKLHQAADGLSGLHNFSAFTNPKVLLENDPVKHLTVGVRRSSGILAHCQPKMADCFDFWEVHFHSSSFLYRQVRRMVGTMLKVAEGEMDICELHQLLEQTPCDDKSVSKYSQFSAPAYGLFLKSVVYKPEDLQYNASEAGDTDKSDTDCTQLLYKER